MDECLSDIFLSIRADEKAEPTLEPALRAAFHRGRSQWPDVALSAAEFTRNLARHLPPRPAAEVPRLLGALHASDLYLATGCALGDQAAIAGFDRSFLSRAPAFLARMKPTTSFADEVCQQARERLLVASGEEPPKIGRYDGSHPLGAWLKVVLTRIGYNLLRGKAPAPLPDDNALPDGADPELDYLRLRYRREFTAALRAAMAELARRDRNLLGFYHREGLTLDQIGGLYGVHKSTVSRWLARAHAAVLDSTRASLAKRLRLGESDLESMMRLVQSQIDIGLSTLLE